MKRILPFLLAISFTSANSQNYIPLPIHTGAWLQGLFGLIGPMYQPQIPGNDTVIGGQTYTSFPPNNPFITPWFAIRENQNHQVYMQVYGGPNEFLLYDFNLIPGDTFLCGACEYLYGQILEWKLDSTATMNIGGISRLAYYFTSISPNYGGQQDVWIQGIGSTKGLTYAALTDFPDNIHVLGCFEEDGEIVFTQPIGPPDPCALLTNIPQDMELELQFILNDKFGILQNTSNFKLKGVVTNILGQNNYSINELPPGKSITIPMANGLNCLRIVAENGQTWNFKTWIE